jgi:hypothetical protein
LALRALVLATVLTVPLAFPVLAQESASLRAEGGAGEFQITVYAGGDIDAAGIESGCVGMVGETPQLALTFTAPPGQTLIVQATSPGDVSLAVNGPDGQWYCNDDTMGLNPQVLVPGAASGRYNIHLGAVSAADQGRETELILRY